MAGMYDNIYRDMREGDLIQGLKTTCWYEITNVSPSRRTFNSKIIALGPDNAGRHHFGKKWDADHWSDQKVLYQRVERPSYSSLAVGDVLLGRSTGAIYRITSLDDHRLEFRAKVIAHGNAPCSVRIGNYTEPRHFDIGAYTQFREYGKTIIQPTTTNTAETGTITQENPMNNSNIIKAIDDLVAEDTATAVRPIYRKITKLVDSVRVGECLVITDHKNDAFGIQFYGREAADHWCYGNGTERLTTERVISRLVQWRAGSKSVRIVHLTAKSGK